MDTPLVLLCSKQASVDQVAGRAERTPGLNCLIVGIPERWSHSDFPRQTSGDDFKAAQADRATDLSLKRNLGLVLARLHGWNKVVFVDDDIIRTESFSRLTAQLDDHQIAGMVVPRHPDNSVVCHARRLADLDQDVFVSGAVLGVHCNSLPLSFFPDIYNEDWFFFAEEAASRQLPRVGQAVQLEYDAFADPTRARREEFGDLLAEGLFARFGQWDADESLGQLLRSTTASYWSQFIEARHEAINGTRSALLRFADRDPGDRRIRAALASLDAASGQLSQTISPQLCVEFVNAWREDLAGWQQFTTGISAASNTACALESLGLGTWTAVGSHFTRMIKVHKLKRSVISKRIGTRIARGPAGTGARPSVRS